MSRRYALRLSRRLRLEEFERRDMLSVTFVYEGFIFDDFPDGNLTTFGDFDSDGDEDAVHMGIEITQFWLNDGSGSFTLRQQLAGSILFATSPVVVDDVDGDGDLDVVYPFYDLDEDADGIRICINDGSAFFEVDSVFPTGGQLRASFVGDFELADLDDDGDLDLIDQATQIWTNEGGSEFAYGGRLIEDFGHFALEDFDGDRDLDAVVGDGGPFGGFSKVYRNVGGVYESYELDDAMDPLAVGDVDRDGDLDFVVGRGTFSMADPIPAHNFLYLNDGLAGFAAAPGRSPGEYPLTEIWLAELGDVDGDGGLDLAVVLRNIEGGGGRREIWLNNGYGVFDDKVQLGPPYFGNLEFVDIDSDGDLDFSHNGEVWLTEGNLIAGDANRDGEFNQLDIVSAQQAAKYLSGEPATWSEGDWNGDGVFNQLDIVAALETGNYLQGPDAALLTTSAANSAEVDELLADPFVE